MVLFSNLQNISDFRESLARSLESLHSFLRLRGLDLVPHKPKMVIFSRGRNNRIGLQNITLLGVNIPQIDSVRFLGVVLDEKLNGKTQSKSLITKGTNIARIILSLSGGELIHLFSYRCTDQFSGVQLNTVLRFLACITTRVFGPESNDYNTALSEQPWAYGNPLLFASL